MQGRRGSAGILWSHSSWKISLRSSSPTINSALPGPALSHGPEHRLFEHFQGQWLQHFPGLPTSHQGPCDSVSSAADSAPRGSHLQGWGVWGAVSLHRRSPGWLDLKLLPPAQVPVGIIAVAPGLWCFTRFFFLSTLLQPFLQPSPSAPLHII